MLGTWKDVLGMMRVSPGGGGFGDRGDAWVREGDDGDIGAPG